MSEPEDLDNGASVNLEKLLEQKARLEGLIQQKFSKYVTVMFTDLKGSTSMAEESGDLATRMLIRDHNNIVFPEIKDKGGVLVKSMGDGTLSYFVSTQDAVRAAVGIQTKCRAYNSDRNNATPILIRIGMHTGSVIMEKNDIFGDVVNTASRFESGSSACEIHISEETYQALSDKEEHPCRFLKETMLKGKSKPAKVYKVFWRADELAEFDANPAAHMASPVAPPAPQAALPAGESQRLQQANSFQNSNDLLQLYLFCEDNASAPHLAAVVRSLMDRLQGMEPLHTRFFGHDAIWHYKAAITLGRLQNADVPLTNKALSRAPITLGMRGGDGFIRGSDNIGPVEVETPSARFSVAPNMDYPLGKSGKLIFSGCFPADYKVYKDRFLVIRFLTPDDGKARAQLGRPLSEIWNNHAAETSRLVVIGK